MLLVRTDKRSVKHITRSAVSFCFHYACHLMLRNVVLAASARILPAGKMVQAIVRFVCVPNRKPRTETVQYEYIALTAMFNSPQTNQSKTNTNFLNLDMLQRLLSRQPIDAQSIHKQSRSTNTPTDTHK